MYINNSLGHLGYVGRVASDRLKGFLTGVIDAERCQDVAPFLGMVEDAMRITEDTRFSIRLVFTRDGLDGLISQGRNAVRYIEAVVPADGRYIVYFGHNREGRRSSWEERRAALCNIETARRKAAEPLNLGAQLRELEEGVNPYRFELLGHADIGERLNQLAGMLRPFNYNEEAVLSILSNPDNSIAIAVNNGNVACVAIAESADIALDDGTTLKITEITDAISREEHRGRNLYALASGLLLTREGMRGRFIYGEYNLDSIAVLVSIMRQGWRWGLDTDRSLPHLQADGFLEQASSIEGRLRNLLVATIDGDAREELGRILRTR